MNVEDASHHAAAPGRVPGAPDAVAHMGVGVVVDAGFTQGPDESAELFDLLIPPWQIEGDLRNVVDCVVGNAVNLDTVGSKAVFETAVEIGVVIRCLDSRDHRPLDAELLQVLQVLVSGCGVHVGSELNTGAGSLVAGNTAQRVDQLCRDCRHAQTSSEARPVSFGGGAKIDISSSCSQTLVKSVKETANI